MAFRLRLSSRVPTQLLRLSLSLSLGLLIVGLPLAAFAQFVPPDRGLPGRREGGGTRGGCTSGEFSRLIALLPQTNLGLTTEESPRFMWYLPSNQAEQMVFSLYRANSDQLSERSLVYQTVLNPMFEGGIASFQLPSQVEGISLEIGQDYLWAVTLICDAETQSYAMQVVGWVQRVEVDPGLKTLLEQSTLHERVDLYAQNGLWFDTLQAITALRQAHPDQPALMTEWTSLLESVELENIADQPLLPDAQPVVESVESDETARPQEQPRSSGH